MKAIVSVLGRFHAFELARELAARGSLERLYTSYPHARAVSYGVPGDRVSAKPLHEIGNRAAQRVPGLSAGCADPRWIPCHLYDHAIASQLRGDADVFLGWSGSSLACLMRARDLGMRAFVERGSTHILHQRAVLSEEYRRFDVRGRLPHPKIVERELREYELADRIVVPTRFCRETFVRHGVDPARIIVSPYGVSLESFYPPREPTPAADGTFTILHCGNVSLRKGCHRLLRVFRQMRLKGAVLRFVGPIAPEMKPFIERWGGEDTIFHGRLPQSELVHLYHRASVFCLASLEEGMAMVVPQAMASGLPVVATHQSGAGEAVRSGKEGLLFNACNDAELEHALTSLWRAPELAQEMGKAAVRRVRSGFRWEDYGDRIHQAYGEALDQLAAVHPRTEAA